MRALIISSFPRLKDCGHLSYINCKLFFECVTVNASSRDHKNNLINFSSMQNDLCKVFIQGK